MAWLLLTHTVAEQGLEPEDIGAKLIRKGDAVAVLAGFFAPLPRQAEGPRDAARQKPPGSLGVPPFIAG